MSVKSARLVWDSVRSDYKNGLFSGRLITVVKGMVAPLVLELAHRLGDLSRCGHQMSYWFITRRIRPMLKFATTMLKNFLKDEAGQDLVEYALLLVFIALAAIAVLPTLGKAVNNVFSQSASTLTSGS
jgi:pilus assembly protein Flp/PilA